MIQIQVQTDTPSKILKDQFNWATMCFADEDTGEEWEADVTSVKLITE